MVQQFFLLWLSMTLVNICWPTLNMEMEDIKTYSKAVEAGTSQEQQHQVHSGQVMLKYHFMVIFQESGLILKDQLFFYLLRGFLDTSFIFSFPMMSFKNSFSQILSKKFFEVLSGWLGSIKQMKVFHII